MLAAVQGRRLFFAGSRVAGWVLPAPDRAWAWLVIVPARWRGAPAFCHAAPAFSHAAAVADPQKADALPEKAQAGWMGAWAGEKQAVDFERKAGMVVSGVIPMSLEAFFSSPPDA